MNIFLIHIMLFWVLLALAPATGASLYSQGIQNSQCDSSITNDSIPRSFTEPENLPPGTVKMHAAIINMDSSGRAYILRIKILNILSYGAATPLLTPGKVIPVRIPSFETTNKQRFEAGLRKVFILQHVQQMELFEDAPDWELIETVNNNITPDN